MLHEMYGSPLVVPDMHLVHQNSSEEYLGHHRIAKARDHTHDLANRAHLQDVLQLVLQDAHGEVALLDAVHDLLLHLVLWHHILDRQPPVALVI